MNRISLTQIKKDSKTIMYSFSFSSSLSQYFTDTPFFIEYPMDVTDLPDSIAAIPFVCNVAPIAWIANAILEIPELDEDFAEALPKLRCSFQEMYPEAHWSGNIKIGKIVKHHATGSGSAVFYSGGADSIHTLVRHISEKPHLLSIWGSDVRYDNEGGWTTLENMLANGSKAFDLPSVTIRSSFRAFDNEHYISCQHIQELKKDWWYGVKHGMAIIGHAAPYVWAHKIRNLYIASSNCPADGKVRCASDPSIDNLVSFCGCQTHHDAFEYNRQDKIQDIVDYFRLNKHHRMPLHVCWQTQTGKNCCNCEKCYRTIVGLWIAQGDPADYGFELDDDIYERIYDVIALSDESIPKNTWTYMKDALRKDWKTLKKDPNCKRLKWMLNFDFKNREANVCRRRSLRWRSFKNGIKKFFPFIHQMYRKLK